ncbi:MAG: hypothetical protein GF384_01510 [Elusimicrobia bacterium]|nr:hypothetical protein [Elusimicrobiota bacterium]
MHTSKMTRVQQRFHHRFPIMHPTNTGGYVRMLPHFVDVEMEGMLVNISAGGMALRLPKKIPVRTTLYIQVILPNKLCIASHVKIKHVQQVNSREYITGVQFLDLAPELKTQLIAMSNDFIECGKRIKRSGQVKCLPKCLAQPLCSRTGKS